MVSEEGTHKVGYEDGKKIWEGSLIILITKSEFHINYDLRMNNLEFV
jgi:hypothetical protein